MVTEHKMNFSSYVARVDAVVILLCTWILISATNSILFILACASRCWNNIARMTLLGVLILVVGTSFDQLNAQSTTTTTPEITIEANPYRFAQHNR